MAKDPAFLFYPGDYLRDTQCLSEPVQVAYDRIMCEHMRNICISQQQLNFFTKRLNSDQKDELMQVLSKVPGGFQISWVAESIEKRRNYSESRRNNRKGTKKHINNISKTYDSHMENEIENVNEDEIKTKNSKLEIFQTLFGDDIFIEQLNRTHKGKDLKQAFEECYTHHSNAPNPPQELWEWKQKLNTWLTIKKPENGLTKKEQQNRSNISAFAARVIERNKNQ